MESAQAETINWQELTGFTPRQVQAIEATYTHQYILYGGARGGGKSRLIRWWLLEFLINQFIEHGRKNVVAGLFCETYPELTDRQISKIEVEFPAWAGELKESRANGLGFYIREELGGGVLALRNLDDPSKYQSAEWAAIGVDELTKLTKEIFDILRGSKRWSGISHTVFMGATNPGGIGHLWVKQLWIDRQFPPEMQAIAHQFVFIQSLPKDNPYLEQSYWDDLNSLEEPLRKAWVEGNWDIFAGQAFTSWRRDRHVIPVRELPAHWYRWRAVDWGYSNPWCCLWLAKDPDRGRIYVYREAYATGLTDREQARFILDMTPPGEEIGITYADPSMWSSREYAGTRTTTAGEYAAEGVILTRADNDRLTGKRKVDRLLMDLADGQPGIQIFESCKNLIRTLPALPYDETRKEDIDTEAEDHAYDALRYGLSNAAPSGKQPDDKNKRRTRFGMIGARL